MTSKRAMNLNVINSKSHKIENVDLFDENRYFRCCKQDGCHNLTIKGQAYCTNHSNSKNDENIPQNVYYMNTVDIRNAYKNISNYIIGKSEMSEEDIKIIADFTNRSPKNIWDYVCDRVKENRAKFSDVNLLEEVIDICKHSSNNVYKSIINVYDDMINQNKLKSDLKESVQQFVEQILPKIEQEYSNKDSLGYRGVYPSNNKIEQEMIREQLRNLRWCVCKIGYSNDLNINFWRDQEWK